ncbi:MAG: TIGR02186 family protein [Alphaproteobacteria bacterium]
MIIIRYLLVILSIFLSSMAFAKGEIEAALSNNLVPVTMSYKGSEVTLMGGAFDDTEVIVEVRGLPGQVRVWQKKRVFGIWVNRNSVLFDNVPGFYMLAASKDIHELMDEESLRQKRIGMDSLIGRPMGDINESDLENWRQALIRNMQQQGRWISDIADVHFVGDHLFRARLRFPANAPIGAYEVYIYAVKDGDIVSAQTTSLNIDKAGFIARIWEMAQFRPLLYGILSTIIACALGYGMMTYLQRRR